MAIHVLSICCYAKLFCHAPPYPKAWKSAQNIGEISFCVKCEHGLEFASKNTKTFIMQHCFEVSDFTTGNKSLKCEIFCNILLDNKN